MFILILLRALFVLLMAAVGFFFAFTTHGLITENLDFWILPVIGIVLGVLLVCIDVISPRKKLVLFSGTFLGLIVGLVIAYILSFIVQLFVTQWAEGDQQRLTQFINMLVSVMACYLSISFILQTKDDIRFIIPYVEFSKATKGARPILVDTSVLIDGRITEIATTGIIESQLIVPHFVLLELQQIADSADKLKRNRGRRGLDVLAKLRNNSRTDVAIYDPHREEET